VQAGDVEELLARGARVVVLSRGQQERLRVPSATVEWIEERDVRVHVLRTQEAVERYNELAAGDEPVGALIHSTC
ncbi:MAG: MTH938/NDUFAF3 family protein, partial [Gemmatimonadota bacterium]